MWAGVDFWASLVFMASAIVPLWRIAARAGFPGWLCLLPLVAVIAIEVIGVKPFYEFTELGVLYFGFLAFSGILAFARWPSLNSGPSKEGIKA